MSTEGWEKVYIETLVDKLQIGHNHDVLEIGYGKGYASAAISSYKPRSHIVIESDENVILGMDDSLRYQLGDWHTMLKEQESSYSIVKKYDRILLDKFCLDDLEFIDQIMLFHCKPGARISFCLNETLTGIICPSKKYTYQEERIFIKGRTGTNLTPLYVPIIELRAP